MPSKISPGRFIRDAILKHLASHAFAPPPLPPIEETRWPACYGSSDETADIVSSSVPHCDYYQQTGFAVFHHCIFLILVDELVDKPATYFSALQVAIQCPEVLTALVKKIDEKLFEKIGTARVDGGFYQLVGVMWEINGHLTENVAKQLRPFLEPLLEAAGAAYTL
ncbi:hypothetical protein C8R47DRAFT_1135229 [Mycena vitilis]|nr:hypothetical protein C8R47DRAFT_1135229 [Mycena vitilis]